MPLRRNPTLQSCYITGPREFQDFATKILSEPPLCLTVRFRQLGSKASFEVLGGRIIRDDSSGNVTFSHRFVVLFLWS